MPVVRFEVVWPDGEVEACYSPSSIIKNYFTEGSTYTVDEFSAISEVALNAASHRVYENYGYPCLNAMRQLEIIKTRCSRLSNQSRKPLNNQVSSSVKVTRFID